MVGHSKGPGLPVRTARWAVRHSVSRHSALRGSNYRSAVPTLLTVNYGNRGDTRRLVASWRRFVSPTWPIVIVENSGVPAKRHYPGATRVVGVGLNLHHGLALDLGLSFVRTAYTVICDPDSVIVSQSFWDVVRPLVDDFAAASIDLGTRCYHPIGMAFKTSLWKQTRLSMEQDWSRDLDVAAELTLLLGGTRAGSLLKRTRAAGRALPTQGNGEHYIAEVYADIFSNTFGASRIRSGPHEFSKHEGSLDEFRRLHALWRTWADKVIAGSATVSDFDTMVGKPERADKPFVGDNAMDGSS
jgi:hypothetical protein